MTSSALLQARDYYAQRTWGEAYAHYAKAAMEAALQIDDLERHAIAAHLIGRNDEGHDILSAGYREAIRTGESVWAARFAFWLGHDLMFEDRMSEASGWFTRARQLLASIERECPEHGYLSYSAGGGAAFRRRHRGGGRDVRGSASHRHALWRPRPARYGRPRPGACAHPVRSYRRRHGGFR